MVFFTLEFVWAGRVSRVWHAATMSLPVNVISAQPSHANGGMLPPCLALAGDGEFLLESG